MDSPAGNIAVVGSGNWGNNLVRNFHALGALKLICDKNQSALSNLREQYPDVDTCLALSDVIARDDIQGVVIATPAETHYSLGREVLLAEKHLFVEKPLVLREAEGEELIELADDRGLVMMVGHLLQYHPAFTKLNELAKTGVLGRINYIYSNRLNLGKIRREENILWSFAPHDISMILTLADDEPETVYATGGNYLHNRIADVTTTHLEFASGLKAHIFVSWLHPFKEQKLVVVGDKKMAVFDDTQRWEDKLRLYPHQIDWQNNAPVPVKGESERVDIREDEPLRLECKHFLDCVRSKTTPITDGHEAVRVLRILTASQDSLNRAESGNGRVQNGMPLGSSPSGNGPDQNPSVQINETAIVDDNCIIGDGTRIWHFSHILSGSVIGQECNIGQNVVIGPGVSVGKGCRIQNNVCVYQGVTLEEDVFCGPSMVFTNVYNPRAAIRRMSEIRPTLVRTGATIGANATIICGVTIGKYALVGAGAVVNRDVPDHAIVVGNPSQRIGWVCRCGGRLNNDLKCTLCDEQHGKEDDGQISPN